MSMAPAQGSSTRPLPTMGKASSTAMTRAMSTGFSTPMMNKPREISTVVMQKMMK